MKPIADKAEVSIDFPDKVYMGSFGRESGFEVRIEPEAMLLKLARRGEHRRIVEFHLHYHLLADVLRELAGAIAAGSPVDDLHRAQLADAVAALHAALAPRVSRGRRRRPVTT